jgi:hypothetical protein
MSTPRCSLSARLAVRTLHAVFLILALPLRATTWAQPLGAEFQANTYTADSQSYPAVAADADGDFVVVWQSGYYFFSGPDQDGDAFGIFGQRYTSAGTAVGAEFQVNTYTTGSQFDPAAAADADGDFVVVWQSYGGQDGSYNGVFGQRYTSAGAALGAEFQVNTYTTGGQVEPAVAVDGDGNFVVVWASDQDGSNSGVFAQRYTSAGATVGAEFQVNTFTTGNQGSPAVAADADGDFVVVWRSNNQDGSENGVFAQRFTSAGAGAGAEFQVNTYTTGGQYHPTVASDADGDLIVIWSSFPGEGGAGIDVFGQRYTSAGAAAGAEFQVNTYTTGGQARPAVAADAAGNFLVTWETYASQDGSDTGIFGRRYTSAGAAITGEFQVNAYTTSIQRYPAVTADADGSFVVVWASYPQDGNDEGVFGRRFRLGPTCAQLSFMTGSPGGMCGRINDDPAGTGTNLTPYGGGAAQLDCGTLYMGGGLSAGPPSPTPDGTQTIFNVSDCTNTTGHVLAAATSTDTGSARNCSAPGCTFGPPVPIPNAGSPAVSICITNTIAAIPAVSGTLDATTGASTVTLPLTVRIRVTGDLEPAAGIQPCPRCTGGTCDSGSNWGGTCTTTTSLLTSHDCPVTNQTLIPFNVDLSPLTTGTSTLTSGTGVFCPGPPVVQRTAGCLGEGSGTCKYIEENGVPAGNLAAGESLPATLASTFCIAKSSGVSNLFYDLPGPGAVSLKGTADLVPVEMETSTVSGGGSVTTDDELDGATAGDPVETTVTTPNAGTVTIMEGAVSSSPPLGFAFLGHEVRITAPTATPSAPLVLVFELDASIIPVGEDENSITLFRNGVVVPACSGTPGEASPDPGVDARVLQGDGDVEVTVLTSSASAWNFGVLSTTVLPIASPWGGAALAGLLGLLLHRALRRRPARC